MTWPQVALGTIAEIQLGKMLSPKARSGESSFAYLRNANVQWGRLDLSDLAEMSFDQSEQEKFSLRRNDMLVCEGGEPGRSAIVEQDIHGVFFQKALMRVRRKDRRLDMRFLQHFMAYAASRGTFASDGNQATIAHFPAVRLNALQVPLPPIGTQRRIADILDKADTIRRKRKEAMALTYDLLHAAFNQTVGPAASGYDTWPERTLESLAANVPGSMRTGPFGSDLLHSEFVSEGIAVLGIDNAVQNRFAWGERRFITPEKYDRLRRYTVHPGDVLVTIMGTTGRSAVVPEDCPTAITTKHLATITVERQLAEPEFVSQALVRHPDVLGQIASANRGAIMSGLNLGIIKGLRVRVPPLSRQKTFTRATQAIRTMAARMAHGSGENALFDSLVARAFSGGLI